MTTNGFSFGSAGIINLVWSFNDTDNERRISGHCTGMYVSLEISDVAYVIK